MGRLQSIGCGNTRHDWGRLFRISGIYSAHYSFFCIRKIQKLIISLVTRCMQMSNLARTIGFRNMLAYPLVLEIYTQDEIIHLFRIYIVDLGHVTAGTWSHSSMRSRLAGHLAYWTLFVTSWHVSFCHRMARWAYQKYGKPIVCHKVTCLNSFLLITLPLLILQQLTSFTY